MIRFLQTGILVINFVIFCVFRGIITRTRHYYGDSKSQRTGVIAQNYGGGYSGEEQSRKVSENQSVKGCCCYWRDIFSLCSRLHQNFTKSEHFKVGTALVTLLQQPDLLRSDLAPSWLTADV